jgi:hypothetical protein
MAEEALRVAGTLRQELERDRKELASLIKSMKPKDETPARFIALALAAGVCALIVVFSARLMPAAFTAPPPNYGTVGIAGLYVWQDSLNKNQAGALQEPGISLSVWADQRSSHVEYVATFPDGLIGDRFVLGMSGSAVLTEFKTDVSGASNEYPDCQEEGEGGKTLPATCQLITGIIPSASDESAIGCRSMADQKTISVSFSGNAQSNSSFDWAHQIASLPYLGDVPGAGSGSVDDLVFGAFGQNFPAANLTSCYYLGLDPELTDYTPNFQPTTHIGDSMAWDPASNVANYIVVSTERSAEWKGDALLAVLGVFGPALLSFLGMTLRSGYRLRSESRRRRARPVGREP